MPSHPSNNVTRSERETSLLSELGLLDVPGPGDHSHHSRAPGTQPALPTDVSLMDMAIPHSVSDGGLLDMNVPPPPGDDAVDEEGRPRYFQEWLTSGRA